MKRRFYHILASAVLGELFPPLLVAIEAAEVKSGEGSELLDVIGGEAELADWAEWAELAAAKAAAADIDPTSPCRDVGTGNPKG